jgi:hypothetical protein
MPALFAEPCDPEPWSTLEVRLSYYEKLRRQQTLRQEVIPACKHTLDSVDDIARECLAIVETAVATIRNRSALSFGRRFLNRMQLGPQFEHLDNFHDLDEFFIRLMRNIVTDSIVFVGQRGWPNQLAIAHVKAQFCMAWWFWTTDQISIIPSEHVRVKCLAEVLVRLASPDCDA